MKTGGYNMRKICIILLMAEMISCGVQKNIITQEGQPNAKKIGEKEKMQLEFSFAEATQRKIFGDLDRAIILYRECLKIDPENTASLYELSNIYNYLGDKELAVQYAEKAFENEKSNKWYGMLLAGLYHQEGNIDKAIEVYREMAAGNPEEMDIKYNLATLYVSNGEYQDALTIFEEMEQSLGITEMVNMAKYNIYSKEGKHRQAANELKRLISAFPEEIKYRGLLAELYDEMGEDEKAVKAYQDLFKIDPENGLAQMSVSSYYRRKREYGKSLEWFEMAVENPEIELDDKIQAMLVYLNQPDILEKYSQKIEIIIEKLAGEYPEEINAMALAADYYIKTKNPERARPYLKKMTEINPENFGVWEQWIFMENEAANYVEIVRIAEQAMKIFPEVPNLYLYICIGLFQIEEYDRMIEYAEAGTKYSNNNDIIRKELYALLGEGYHALGENEKSDWAFEEALKIKPNDIMVLNNYAYYLSERGSHLKKALEMSRKCIEKEPENYIYLDTCAWILYKMEETDEALVYIRKSIEAGGQEDPEILEHYGDILYEGGKTDEAVNAWKRSVENGNMKEEIKKKIGAGEGRKR
ncbi:MAG: tetratricopeptide repeat protein [Bacteroidales bacterium]